MNHVTNASIAESRMNWVYRFSGWVAMILAGIFLIGLLNLIILNLYPGAMIPGLSQFEDFWLLVLFKLNAGFEGVQYDQLYGLKLLDILVMFLAGLLCIGLFFVLRRTSRIWSMIAVVMPFLGIPLLIVTGNAGRSSVMGSGLVISFVMLRSDIFRKEIAWVGILATVFLLVGDFGTSADTHSTIVASLVGLGYVLLMAWCFLVGRRFFQLAR